MGLTTLELIQTAVQAAEGKRAADPVILDLRGISSVTDYCIVCSGSSDTNVRAIADAVVTALKTAGHRPFGVEGHKEGTWILMDYVDFVFHVFYHEKRLVFSLEDLWKDAPQVPLEPAASAAGEGA